ncbi:MAG: TIGR02221 family CRISPR-associated protein [Candidatus Cryptobacteroides sp.]
MGRKVFLSFLGGSNYNPCQYRFPDGSVSPELRFIQEATLLHLEETGEWTSSDVAYILLTESAKERNWEDNGQKNRDGGIIKAEGLATRLCKAGLVMEIRPVDNVPECKDSDDIMTLFSLIFRLLKDGDRLYLDLTHGYRYMPMLMLVLSSYSRFLKNIEVKSITYGNYEGVDRDCKVKPVIDLLPLASLLDWTFAAGQYVKSGDVDELVRLSNEELTPILKQSKGKNTNALLLKGLVNYLEKFINERRFCRGKDIVLSNTYCSLNDYMNVVESNAIIPALKPILQKIHDTFDGISSEENVVNGYVAAQWCCEHGLYQQAVTILFENMVSEICIEAGLDWQNKEERLFIGAAKTRYSDPKKKIELPEIDDAEQKLSIVMDTESFNRLLPDYSRLTEIRNDLNHAGINLNKEFDVNKVKKTISEIIRRCLNKDADQFFQPSIG